MEPSLSSPLLQRFNRHPHSYAVQAPAGLHPHSYPVEVLPGLEPACPPCDRRPACLDIFTGLCILGMLLSRALGDRFPALGHCAWDGIHFGDLLAPFLLFAVGASLAAACQGPSPWTLPRVLIRSSQLFLLGVLLDGGFFHSLGDLTFGVSITDIRTMGFLQRVAVSLLLVGLCHVAVRQREPDQAQAGDCCSLCSVLLYHWQAALLVAMVYLSLTFFLFVPDWDVPMPMSMAPAGTTYTASLPGGSLPAPGLLPVGPTGVPPNVSSLTVPCRVSGDLSPACSAAGYIDRTVLGLGHLYRMPSYRNLPECEVALGKDPLDVGENSAFPAWCLAPFEPAGVLSTLGGVMTAFLGLHFGHVLTQCQAHGLRLAHTVPLGVVLAAGGWLLQFPFSLALPDILPLDHVPAWAQVSSPGIPFNLSLFSTSLALFSGGLACLIISAIYVLADLWHVRFYTKLFEWSGKNWLLVYACLVAPLLGTLLTGFYFQQPENNLINALQWLLDMVFHNKDWSLVAGALLKMAGCGLLCGLVHWQGLDFSL